MEWMFKGSIGSFYTHCYLMIKVFFKKEKMFSGIVEMYYFVRISSI